MERNSNTTMESKLISSTISKFMAFAKGYFAQQVKVSKKSSDWEMEEFEQELNTFAAAIFAEGQKKAPKRAAKKESTGPKKPKSAYIFFCAEKREEAKEDIGEDGNNTDILKRLGEMWRELSDEDKEPYVEMATKDKERYAEEAEEAGIEPKTPKTKKKSPSRGVSGYVLFCGEHRAEVQEEMKGEKPTEVTRRLGEMWRELGEEGQQEWNDRAREEREKLKSEEGDEESAPKTPKTKKKAAVPEPKTAKKSKKDEEEPKTAKKSKKEEPKTAKKPELKKSKPVEPESDSEDDEPKTPARKSPARVLPTFVKSKKPAHDESDIEEDD